MNLGRDFDVMMFGRADDIAGLEHKWQLTDFAFLERSQKRPFLARVRGGLRTLSQIRKIRIQITVEMHEPVLE